MWKILIDKNIHIAKVSRERTNWKGNVNCPRRYQNTTWVLISFHFSLINLSPLHRFSVVEPFLTINEQRWGTGERKISLSDRFFKSMISLARLLGCTGTRKLLVSVGHFDRRITSAQTRVPCQPQKSSNDPSWATRVYTIFRETQ